MTKGLRYETGRDMPAGMQVLAVGKIIENEAAAMLLVLQEVDVDCQFCKHANFNVPCAETETLPRCKECQYVCPCRECHENSKYEWCGAAEANKRLADLKGTKAQNQ